MELKSNLRRAQSLKEVSPGYARSWTDGMMRERKKSVSQLVERRSMESLPRHKVGSIGALRALFESKAVFRQEVTRSHNTSYTATENKTRETAIVNGNAETEVSTEELKTQSPPTTAAKEEEANEKWRSLADRREIPSIHEQEKPLTSVKALSALYLSKVRVADSTGSPINLGSVVQDHAVSSAKKIKTSKFQIPAKEICPACLKPVYSMEKMVADKLILHKNCFCCKHCKKKLSIRTYAALYGEFYCMFHYQQLFRAKGNYDEGFGHKQHKDRWLQKATESLSDNNRDHKDPTL
ncbi:hypothetical protein AAFF_G00002890 [Aldrovandia affinis]|uniref:LIM zinc-binding domain-containing protein n=1 Tax=Aldrovandia affinis TaxID=143900 RepID=A0AAD7TD49_9TELE|nr:hypothetical protein AAFF_G00002890 [Aldrovandia affinis]